jgi:hypothetical protein
MGDGVDAVVQPDSHVRVMLSLYTIYAFVRELPMMSVGAAQVSRHFTIGVDIATFVTAPP